MGKLEIPGIRNGICPFGKIDGCSFPHQFRSDHPPARNIQVLDRHTEYSSNIIASFFSERERDSCITKTPDTSELVKPARPGSDPGSGALVAPLGLHVSRDYRGPTEKSDSSATRHNITVFSCVLPFAPSWLKAGSFFISTLCSFFDWAPFFLSYFPVFSLVSLAPALSKSLHPFI